MTPTHSNPTRPRADRKNNRTQWAHAPYNFVPLPEQIVTARPPLDQDQYHECDEDGEPVLTGWIECQLETSSPTYVRGMLTETQFKEHGRAKPDELTVEQKKERAPFFATTEAELEGYLRPVIPGSTLRGMIRMLVEMVGSGRMRWVANKPTFTFRAVAASKDDPLRDPYQDALGRFGSNVEAGYFEKKGAEWWIRPALRPDSLRLAERGAYLKVKEHQIRSKDIHGYLRFDSSDYKPQLYEVSFEAKNQRGNRGQYVSITQIGNRRDNSQPKGVLVTSGNMLETGKPGQTSPRKNHALVLEPDKKAKKLKIRPQVIEDYKNGLTPFEKKEVQEAWGGNPGCLADGKPVFYVAEEDEVIYFGHCPNFRIPALLHGEEGATTPRDFLPSEHKEMTEPDLVDAIFGWVEELQEGKVVGPKGQRAGRVFFSDAHFIEPPDSENKNGVWLKPHPLALHVLSEPKPTTFQHYLIQDREKGHNPDNKSSLAHYGTPPSETQIRGHKLYWHKGAKPDIEATLKERDHEKQLTRVVPLQRGVQFAFKIRFENLRQEELGALWWALALPGEPNQIYRHKLGMGKSLGMGAVAITPNLFLSNRQKRYDSLFKKDKSWDEAVSEADPQPYLNAFEKHILEKIGSDKECLSEVKRIQMLLAMLQWRERDTKWDEQTRYMEIEYGYKGINEYKERPVLPDPLLVSGIKSATQQSL